MMRMAETKTQALPRIADVLRAKTANASRTRQKTSRSSFPFRPFFFLPFGGLVAMHHCFALGAGAARIETKCAVAFSLSAANV